jgi:hypothetical protein
MLHCILFMLLCTLFMLQCMLFMLQCMLFMLLFTLCMLLCTPLGLPPLLRHPHYTLSRHYSSFPLLPIRRDVIAPTMQIKGPVPCASRRNHCTLIFGVWCYFAHSQPIKK